MRALVLSGGGCKGAFQVGVLQHLMVDLGIQYEIYCGVSVGAINCGHLALYPTEDGVTAAKDLYELWKNLETKKVYKRWFPFGKLHSLWRKSIYNSKPLKKMMRKRIDVAKLRNSGCRLRVGAVSLTTGEYKIFTEMDKDIVKGIIASSAFPGMLSPAKINGQVWIDGGARNITPLKAAIDAGANIIDVILTSPKSIEQDFDNDTNMVGVVFKTLDIMVHEIMDNDLKIALMINDQVRRGRSDKREIEINIIRPDVHLIDDSLDFSPERLSQMMKYGEKTAKLSWSSSGGRALAL